MEGMTTHTTDDDALDAFVDQLLQTSFALMTIVDSMMRYAAAGHSAPDAPPIPAVLSDLLRGVLPGLLTTHSREAVEHATAVLDGALEIVCDEIHFVSPEASSRPRPHPAPRRRRRPR
jgi:hypothetical protein